MENMKKEMTKEEFRELAKDMRPIIEQMEEIIQNHNVTDIVSLTMDTEGYFRFYTHNSDWEFKRVNKNMKSQIRMTICEDL